MVGHIILALSITLNIVLFLGIMGASIVNKRQEGEIKVLEYQRDQLKRNGFR